MSNVLDNSLHRISTIDALINTISKRILDGDIKQGTQLKEADLAEFYKVSRHSIREAFIGLAKEGLLVRETNRGVFVPILTISDVKDLYRVRAIFELEAVKTLAQQGLVTESMNCALECFERKNTNSKWSEIVEADVAFHKALVDALESARTASLYQNLISEFKLCIRQSHNFYVPIDIIIKKHRGIVEAIKACDVEKAVTLIRIHLENSVKEHLEGYPNPYKDNPDFNEKES